MGASAPIEGSAGSASLPGDGRQLRAPASWRVLDDVEPLVAQPGNVLEHALHLVLRVAVPVVHLDADEHRVSGAVGARDVAEELLVGDIRVVFERPGRFDNVDPAPPVASGERRGQFSSPNRWFEESGEVDVIRNATIVVIRGWPATSSSLMAKTALVPWKNGPSTWPQLSNVTGT